MQVRLGQLMLCCMHAMRVLRLASPVQACLLHAPLQPRCCQAVQQGALPAQQLQQLLDTLLQRDLQPLLPGQQQQQQRLQLGDAGRQFLLGRALRVCAKLHEAASPAQRQSLLQAAAAAGAARPAGARPLVACSMHATASTRSSRT